MGEFGGRAAILQRSALLFCSALPRSAAFCRVLRVLPRSARSACSARSGAFCCVLRVLPRSACAARSAVVEPDWKGRPRGGGFGPGLLEASESSICVLALPRGDGFRSVGIFASGMCSVAWPKAYGVWGRARQCKEAGWESVKRAWLGRCRTQQPGSPVATFRERIKKGNHVGYSWRFALSGALVTGSGRQEVWVCEGEASEEHQREKPEVNAREEKGARGR